MPFAAVRQKGNRVIVRFVNAPTCDEDVTSYLEDLRHIYDQNQKFIILYDALEASRVSMRHLKMQADFMHEQADRTQGLMVRAAIVLNPVMKVILDMLFSLRRPACEYRVFSSLDEAKSYLAQANI